MQGHTVNIKRKTIPEYISPCNQISNIVIVKGKCVSILGLIVPFELNIENTYRRKCEKYGRLVSAIESEGSECFFFYAIEVESIHFSEL